MKFIAIALLLAALVSAKPKMWAVVLAGSNTYSNYRHQSDVAHQYWVFREMGVPEENIVTFSFNDVVNNAKNPFPGEVFALPGDNPRDYNKGLVLDYTGSEVNKKNFFAVLLGDKTKATGRVISPSAEDNVFISYYDHGGVDLIACIKDYIYRKELHAVLKEMNEKKMYNKLVFYIEACDSATMAYEFPSDLNIYIVTSTDKAVSGWACFCPPEDIVRGKHIGACISEEFGTMYMMNMDETKGKTTWQEQFDYIAAGMKKSKPAIWADKNFINTSVDDFYNNRLYQTQKVNVPAPTSFWDTRDNNMLFWANQLTLDLSPEERQEAIIEYKKEIAVRAQADQFFDDIVAKNVGSEWTFDMFDNVDHVDNTSCYYDALERVHNIIPRSDYVMKYFNVFANICDKMNIKSIVM